MTCEYDGKKAELAPRLKNYPSQKVDCMTPLYDSVAHVIRMNDALELAKSKPKPIIVILTDGMENYSTEFSRRWGSGRGSDGEAKLREMIRAREEAGWLFVFLGATIDAVKVGTDMGISTQTKLTLARGQEKRGLQKTAEGTMSYTAAMAAGASVPTAAADFFQGETLEDEDNG